MRLAVLISTFLVLRAILTFAAPSWHASMLLGQQLWATLSLEPKVAPWSGVPLTGGMANFFSVIRESLAWLMSQRRGLQRDIFIWMVSRLTTSAEMGAPLPIKFARVEGCGGMIGSGEIPSIHLHLMINSLRLC